METDAISPLGEDFSFQTISGGDLLPSAGMCAAEDVFFHGQIIPLHRSASLGPSPCVSRSCSSSWAGSGRSAAGGGGVIRSNSFSRCDAPLLRPARSCDPICRRTSYPPAVGWGFMRIGVMTAPEMRIRDLRSRLAVGDRSGGRRLAGIKKRVDFVVKFFQRTVGCC